MLLLADQEGAKIKSNVKKTPEPPVGSGRKPLRDGVLLSTRFYIRVGVYDQVNLG